jgi:hypothetical protein
MASLDATYAAGSLATRTRIRPGAFLLWCSAFLAAFTLTGSEPDVEAAENRPFVIKLRREAVPVRHKGKVVSYKTSYSGPIHVGSPRPQEFRVVFDTGSGHVILPSSECYSAACVKHSRYKFEVSATATAVNLDGSPVPPGNQSDQVTIGFGTGKIVGEFVRDQVCLGLASDGQGASSNAVEARGVPCVDMHAVMAVEMSRRPFESFSFDGIMGLGLRPLALSSNFSFFQLFANRHKDRPSRFAVFLGGGEDGEENEIAFGGHDPARLIGPLTWVPAAKAELGYWQVKIHAVRIADRNVDWCDDGGCFGIMDTGTSHLGIPGPHEAAVADMLTRPAEGSEDCRRVAAPALQIELQGFNITLRPEDYMRQLPLAGDLPLSSAGVSPTSYKGEAQTETSVPASQTAQDGRMLCKPKLMPVNMPKPLGPKLFILGEPVLHRYYTAYDWSEPPRVGLGLAAHAGNVRPPGNLDAGLGGVSVSAHSSLDSKMGGEKSGSSPIGGIKSDEARYDDPIFLAQVSAQGSRSAL